MKKLPPSICSVDDCSLASAKKGMCKKHYNKRFLPSKNKAANQRRWRLAHQEEIKLYNKAHPYKKAYIPYASLPEERKEYLRAASRLRRSRRKNAPGLATTYQVEQRSLYYDGLCWMCGDMATCIDHVKPLSKGGSNWPANLRPACKPCNTRKLNQWYGVSELQRFKKQSNP